MLTIMLLNVYLLLYIVIYISVLPNKYRIISLFYSNDPPGVPISPLRDFTHLQTCLYTCS